MEHDEGADAELACNVAMAMNVAMHATKLRRHKQHTQPPW
jgi:hypothetical protein